MSTAFTKAIQAKSSINTYEQLLETLQFVVPRPTPEEFFNTLHKQSFKASEIYLTPDRVAKLMAAIGKTVKPQAVLDFTCGTGQLLHACNYAPERMGVDVNPLAIKLARLIQPDVNFVVGDALELDPKRKFDLIIANIPFGARSPQSAPLEKQLVEKALALLSDNGILVVLVPPNLLWARLYEPLRNEILHRYALDMIVTLPSSTLEYTSVSSAILVVRNGPPKDTVYLAEFEENIKQIISNYKMGQGDFQIPVSRMLDRWDRHYYQPKYTQTDTLLDNQYVKTLGEISDITRGYPFRRNDLQDIGHWLVLTPRHLAQGKLQLEPDSRSKYANNIENSRFQRAIIQPDDIVISLVANAGFYVYKADDPPAVANQNLAVIRSNDNEYIRTYLQTSAGRSIFLNQAKRFTTGLNIRHLSIRDLHQIRIPILPISDLNSLSDQEINQSDPNELRELREQLGFYKQEMARLQKSVQPQGSVIKPSVDTIFEQIQELLETRFKSIETALLTIQTTTNQILAAFKDTQTQIQQIKQTPREDEEKLLRIYTRLDEISATITENRRTIDEYLLIVQHWLEHWEYLDETSKTFLTSAEFLMDEIHRVGSEDYSPFIIQYCRAIENEILKKLFEAFHRDFYSRYPQTEAAKILAEDLTNDKTKLFAKSVKNNNLNYTLGQMSFVLQMVKPNGNTLAQSLLLKDFRSFALRYFETYILEAAYLDRIKQISENYRNKAAHPYLLDADTASSCQSLIRESLNEFLAGYLFRNREVIEA